MGVKFGSLDIPGDVLPFQPAGSDIQRWLTQWPDIRGVSEVVGERGGRMIDIPIVLFKGTLGSNNGWRYGGQLQEFLDGDLDDMIGENDTVEIDSNAEQGPYDNCTFIGYSPIGNVLPIQDVAGTLDGGWFMYLMLRFHQLTTE